ncbi:MAG: hypothetical protein QOG26_265 [Solirubrobacterales bacterium]|nr:hypothetical protein [Solirubrobacterales bacterium]
MTPPSPPSTSRFRRGPLAIAGLSALATALVVAGCSFQSPADKDRGRSLFTERCGTCHALAQAGTQATIGPDLDAAFAQARRDGFDSDTIKGIVKAQVENPRPSTTNPAISMPADLVKGKDLSDVAAYVASVAGVASAKPPAAPGGPGGQVFANNGCGSCHTMQAAGTSGTTGPDLDKTLKGKPASYVEESIVDPNAEVAPGYPPNVMPSTFRGLPPDQLKQLVAFILKSVNSGK